MDGPMRHVPLTSLLAAAVTALTLAISSQFSPVTSAQTSTPALERPRFLYSSDFFGNRVLGYTVNPTTGEISPTRQGSTSAHRGPTRVASDKGGNRLYVINQGSKDLSAYFIFRNDGSLHSVPGSPVNLSRTPYGLVVHPSGRYVYATTISSDANPESFIYAFAVQSNGSLRPVPGSPFPTSEWSRALAIDPQGEYLYASTYAGVIGPANFVAAYSISSSDGALTPLPGSPYQVPNSSNCATGAWDVAVHPSGDFLLLTDACLGTVVYRIDRSTGTLSMVKGSPFQPPGSFRFNGSVDSITMDPEGVYFWVTDTYFLMPGIFAATDTWKLNTTTGVPTYLESGIGGCGLLVRSDPSGKFLFEIGDTLSNFACGGVAPSAIWGFSVNRGNGFLKNLNGSPRKSPNSDDSGGLTDGLAITP
jgi:6-phosphogluconolactonase (cycloisomerase 2 family)